MDNYIQWIDLAWLPIVLLAVRKGQYMVAMGFVLANVLMMRLLVELMGSIGYSYGIFPLLDYHIFYRGLAFYSFVYLLYMALVYFSPGTQKIFLLGASISMFFFASFAFAALMVL